MAARVKLLVRAAGSDAVLTRYRKELGSAISREVQGEMEEQFWNHYAQILPSLTTRHRNAMVIELNILPSQAVAAITAVQRAALDNNFLPAFTGRIAPGALIIGIVPLAVDPPSAMQYATAVSALRAQLPPGASAVVSACPTEAKRHFDIWGAAQTDMSSMRRIKQALDPKNILNRGRFVV